MTARPALGLYKTTDDGAHWSLVPGAARDLQPPGDRVDRDRARRPEPHRDRDPRSGVRGIGSNSRAPATVAAQSPATGVYESHDGGANWTLTRPGVGLRGQVRPGQPERAVTRRSAGTESCARRTTLPSGDDLQPQPHGRFSFAPVVKDGKTRIYLADANGGAAAPTGAQVYRVDDASQPAATLTAANNAAWTRLSNPAEGTPGFAVYNYCNTPLVGSQCVYDMFVSLAGREPGHGRRRRAHALRRAEAVRGAGRHALERPAVLMSIDAGATWTDMTGDVGGESMHPDQHALAFVPGNPNQFFVGSDGGVIRTSGKWADAFEPVRQPRPLAGVPGGLPRRGCSRSRRSSSRERRPRRRCR